MQIDTNQAFLPFNFSCSVGTVLLDHSRATRGSFVRWWIPFYILVR